MKSFKIQGRSSARINTEAVKQRKGARDRLVILQEKKKNKQNNFDLKK